MDVLTLGILKPGQDANTAAISTLNSEKADNADLEGVVLGAIPDDTLTAEKTKYLANRNLFDMSTRTVGKYLSNSSGTLTSSASYDTSDFIPVKSGVTYIVNHFRQMLLYNSSQAAITASYVNTEQRDYTFTPSANGYARISFYASEIDVAQVEVGSASLGYLPYGYSYHELEKPKKITVRVSGTDLTIIENVGTKPLLTVVGKAASNNGGFSFKTSKYAGKEIATITDDVTPIRTQFDAVGANHGYDCIGLFTNPDSKDASDVGSVWTDGTREYVLFGISGDGTKVIIGGSYSAGPPVTSADVSPTVNLTHVSGATHTAAIVHSTKTTGQLSPGTLTRYNITAKMNGQELSADGTYVGDELVIKESYEIVDYADLYDKCKANVGTAITELDVDGAVLVQNTFTWKGQGRLYIDTAYDELKPTTLASCGAIQALGLGAAGVYPTRYIPGAGTVGGLNWSNGVSLTSYSSNLLITSTDLNVTGQVPAFALDTITFSGIPQIGFVTGYKPFDTNSAGRSARRLTNAPTALWDLRSTRKCYPQFTTGEAAGWGHLEVSAYRLYLSAAQVTTLLTCKTRAAAAYAALVNIMNI